MDVFLITATNASLLDLDYVKREEHREDFLDRLMKQKHAPIKCPSLAQRREDILPLFMRFLQNETIEINGRWPKTLDPEVKDLISTFTFPGNVPELQGLANEIAKASRDWEEVLRRHVPLPAKDGNKATCPTGPTVPQRNKSEPSVPNISLEQLCCSMSSIEFLGTRPELKGALAKLDKAYRQLVPRLLHAALDLERNPTAAVKTLFDRDDMKTYEAASRIIAILKGSDIPSPDSPLGKVLTWAKELRRGKRRKVSNSGPRGPSEAASRASSADTARE